jgi:hypothetical protein
MASGRLKIMIARGFKSVLWVGAVGSAALGCYMVSLRVATERADLARVEGQIVQAKRDIRTLQTELGTRGRLAQLEDWNANVLALSAPTSGQFVKDTYTLAQLQTHEPTVADRTGEVRMASAETGAAAPQRPAQAPAKPEPEAVAAPRVVHAIAPAPAHEDPIRRASFTPSVAPPPSAAAAKPSKPVVRLGQLTAAVDALSPQKAHGAKPAARSEPDASHAVRKPAETAAAAGKPKASKPKLAAAHADTESHAGGGQRGGAE